MAVPDRRRHRFRGGSIVAFFLTCGLGVLVYLSVVQLQSPEEPSTPTAPPRLNSSADFPDRIEQVTSALAGLPLSLPTPTTVPQGAGALRWTHRRYEMTLPKPGGTDGVERLFAPLHHAAAGVTVQTSEEADGAKVQIGVDGLLTHTLMLHWLRHQPRVAIIVDNLGGDLLMARTLADIGAPLTFAVRSAQPFSKEVAELARLFGREVLMQLPQEPERSAPTSRVGDRAGVERWLSENLTGIPHAVGVANDPGPPLTGNAERTQWILSAAKDNNLFVVETAGERTDTCETAAAVPVPCVQGTRLSDDNSDEDGIRKQLDGILHSARTRGEAVVVGHATPALAAALQSAIPAFAAAGVELVPVSTVVADQQVADQSLSSH
jgi:polysaccharide deacetylase 2 family uncharacterized protein YibQ